MEKIKIEYRFDLNNGNRADFLLEFNKETMELIPQDGHEEQRWTNLDFEKCKHCPLSKETSPQCPAAASLVGIIGHFDNILSYDEIDLEVVLTDRSVKQRTSAQEALSSLFGLLISSSGCPHTAFFKVMARHHLPLSNHEETLCRASSLYLLGQYLLSKSDQDNEFGLDGLQKIYENMQIVNRSVVNRLRSAVKTDATLNAVVLLDGYAQSLPMAIEDSLGDLDEIFGPFFEQIKQMKNQTGSSDPNPKASFG